MKSYPTRILGVFGGVISSVLVILTQLYTYKDFQEFFSLDTHLINFLPGIILGGVLASCFFTFIPPKKRVLLPLFIFGSGLGYIIAFLTAQYGTLGLMGLLGLLQAYWVGVYIQVFVAVIAGGLVGVSLLAFVFHLTIHKLTKSDFMFLIFISEIISTLWSFAFAMIVQSDLISFQLQDKIDPKVTVISFIFVWQTVVSGVLGGYLKKE